MWKTYVLWLLGLADSLWVSVGEALREDGPEGGGMIDPIGSQGSPSGEEPERGVTIDPIG